jgi:hypothetical protein
MSLLHRLLIDLQRRCSDTLDTWNKVEPTLEPEAKRYAEAIRQNLLERAGAHVDRLLKDPDLGDPQFARSFYIDYKRVVELIQQIEEGSLLAICRYRAEDRFATLLVDQIATEIGYPKPAPLCSATSTQYFFAHTGLDLIFVPCAEPYRLLGLSDLYHELAHFLLYRSSAQFLLPIEAEIDLYFDQAVRDARQKGWVQTLIDELEAYRKSWKRDWMIEFGADMVAAYCAGPAYGWANVRLCSNVSADLFAGAPSHPADAARASGIDAVLRRIGCSTEAAEIEGEWKELLGLTAQAKPQGFDLAYPQPLLDKLADSVVGACTNVGLKPYPQKPTSGIDVTCTLNDAWKEFRTKPANFAAWEHRTVTQLKAAFKLP